MTEQEAKEWLANDTSPMKIHTAEMQGENPMVYINSAIEIATKCIEKQIAKKPILNTPIINSLWCEDAKLCPICRTYVDRYSLYEYCKNCGQKLLLDWGNEDDRD